MNNIPRKPVDLIFPTARGDRQLGLCPTCQSPIKEGEFRDKLSAKEFSISGMCQVCQDSVFGGPEDDADDGVDYYNEHSDFFEML